jgi:Trk K+ transport system NAD-binding subunit
MRILPSGTFVLHKGDELIVLGAGDAITSWRVQCGDA